MYQKLPGELKDSCRLVAAYAVFGIAAETPVSIDPIAGQLFVLFWYPIMPSCIGM